MRLSFGNCQLYTDSRQLVRDGREVHLPLKEYTLLEFLLTERPRALSKEELHERLWPGVFVSDVNLANLASALRKAIGDDSADQRLVRTVHGFGYAFCGEATELEPAGSGSAAASAYCLVYLNRSIFLAMGENLLGRGDELAARIDHPSVSRHHARIVVGAHGAELEDLGSKNGTQINGQPVSGRVRLNDQDEILLGKAPLVFRISPGALSTATNLE